MSEHFEYCRIVIPPNRLFIFVVYVVWHCVCVCVCAYVCACMYVCLCVCLPVSLFPCTMFTLLPTLTFSVFLSAYLFPFFVCRSVCPSVRLSVSVRLCHSLHGLSYSHSHRNNKSHKISFSIIVGTISSGRWLCNIMHNFPQTQPHINHVKFTK